MDLLFKHNQTKKDRKSLAESTCDIKLMEKDDHIFYCGLFDLEYSRYGTRKHVTFEHSLIINLNNGDIDVTYKIINDKLTDDKMFRSMFKNKRNNFSLIFDLTENGFYRGEKRINFWGVKYDRALETITNILHDKFKNKIKNSFLKDKTYDKCTFNKLYEMIVDFHLEMKTIKGHDGVYQDIQNNYPQKKWLVKNDYKFLPAILDCYNIKSKYLIGELNKNHDKSIHIESLNYLCRLFGENYIDYIKKINWVSHCYDRPPNKKIHTLKNESEKRAMISLINKWETTTLRTDSLVYNINKLLSIREQLETKNYDLKFTAKNDTDFENTLEIWSSIRTHLSRGYRLKYDIPNEIIKSLEEDIEINGEIFKCKVIISEEDFRYEGFIMKNCMSKQFPNGLIYLYTSIQHKRKRINLQYRKGELVQSYGKANTKVLSIFNEAIDVLTNRIKRFKDITWKKQKYDIIGN